MKIPETMDAVVCREPGDPDVLDATRVAVPRPGPGEVLIRVQAAGVNRADVLQRTGDYPLPVGGNPVLGLEVAGEIAQLGEGVDTWAVGDTVCTLVDGGGYAAYAVAPAVQLLPRPRGYDAVKAAALPESCFTVWANVFQAGGLRAGETALIHGGRGGVGTVAIQLAHAFGARVLATSGSVHGCDDCLALGADVAINYRDRDFADAAREATDGRGVDVILDPIGAANLARNIAALGMDGRMAIIGFTGGSVAEKVDLGPILARRLVITGSAMRPRTPAEKGAIAEALRERVWPILERGACEPPVAQVFALHDAADAHRLMEAGGYLGKVVLTVSN